MINPPIMIVKLFFLIFGMMIGSFLNVLIYRLPRDMNVAYPRSSCTNCGKLIYWYENIPLFSYLFQRGRCTGCGEGISFVYPAIEMLVGLISLVISPSGLEFHQLIYYAFYFSIACIFLVHFIIDLKHQILPDSLNVCLLVIFSIYSIIFYDWTHWVYGGLIGFAIPLFVTLGFYLLTKKVGMGGGDIKLYGCLGILLGPIGIVYNIALSCFTGAVIGSLWLLLNKKSKNDPIPFGPFIIFIAIIQIFFPNLLLNYLKI